MRHGASALGLVSKMPSGPGPIDETLIAEIASTIPPPMATFLLTSETIVDNIIAQQKRCGTNTLQIVDRLTQGSYGDLRAKLPGIKIVQVIHVGGEESIDESLNAAKQGADALLLDSGNQSLPIKLLGGTGRVHDWSISRTICETVGIPVFLAGGLHAGNVREAIETVRPFGIDVCSGVRTDGRLDEAKLRQFVQAVESPR